MKASSSTTGGPVPRLVSRLVEMLDYALNDKESDELILEIVIHGMAMQEDERGDLDEDENPGGMFNERYLGDASPLIADEFSTTAERCSFGEDPITRADILHLRRLLTTDEPAEVTS